MSPAYLTSEQTLAWYQKARLEVVEKIKTQGAGKFRYQCPLCDAMGDFTVLPSHDKDFNVSYFCAECGFRIDDTGLKYFPPPPPPKRFRNRPK